jgi:hypothetical protein
MLIGITGHARHGKDSTADILVSRFGFRKIALADIMKRAVLVMFPTWTDEHMYGKLKDVVDPAYGISPRHVLQELGTGFGQYGLSQYDNFNDTTGRLLWTRALLASIRPNENIVISDVRFPHETEAIRAAGGRILKIARPGYPVDLTHESERAIEEILPDYVISNNLGLAYLEAEVMEYMRTTCVVGLDIDDVLADFIGAYCTRFGLALPTEWTFDPNFDEHYAEVCRDSAFWLNLACKTPARDLDGMNVGCYITSRGCPKDWTELWLCLNEFPQAPIVQVGIDGDKVEAARKYGVDIFIDDRPKNCEAMRDAGIIAFMMDATHNEDDEYTPRIRRVRDIFSA